jgi:hypothetical protein
MGEDELHTAHIYYIRLLRPAHRFAIHARNSPQRLSRLKGVFLLFGALIEKSNYRFCVFTRV